MAEAQEFGRAGLSMLNESVGASSSSASERIGFERFLEARSTEALRLLLPAGAVLYLVVAATHHLFHPPDKAPLLSALAVLLAGACFSGAVVVYYGAAPRWNDSIAFAVAALVEAKVLFQLYWTDSARETAGFALLLVCIGLAYKNRLHFYALLAASQPVWVAISFASGWSREWAHYAFVLLLGDFLAVVAFEYLRNTYHTLFAQENRLTRLAQSDPLTGLRNGAAFQRLLEARSRRRRQGGTAEFAVCFIDMDGFKQVNDVYGHQAGDDVLCVIAKRLLAACREGDFAARFGGDEFVVFFDDVPSAAAAQRAAERLRRAVSLEVTFKPGDAPLRLVGSVGVVWSGDGVKDAEDLLQRADASMYLHKRRSGHGRRDDWTAPAAIVS